MTALKDKKMCEIKVNGLPIDSVLDNGVYVPYLESDESWYWEEEEEYFADPFEYGDDEESYGGFRKIIHSKKEFQ